MTRIPFDIPRILWKQMGWSKTMTIEHEQNLKANTGISSEAHKFTRDIIWLTIAQLFVSVILGIVTLPALTKTYPSAIYGVWIQASVTVGLISPLLSLQLGLALVRFLAGVEDKAKRRQALGAMLTAIVIFTCLVSIIALPLSKQLSVLLFATPIYVDYISFIIIWTFFNSIYNFLLAYLRVRGKMKEVSIYYVALTIMQMIFIVGLAKIGASLESIIISMIALYIGFSLVIFLWIVKDIGFPRPNFTGLNVYLYFSIPQMPVVILLWIMSLSDRYFITHFLGLSQDGIYSSSNTVAGLTMLFYAPISYVLFPLVSKLWEERRSADVKNYLEYSIKLYLTFAIPGALGIAVLSQPLLKLLTTTEFLVGEQLVLLLALGGIFIGVYQINMNLILLGKRAKLLPLITAIGTVASLVLNILLIPYIGIMGAAFSNCISYFILALVITLLARKTIKYEFNYKYLGKVILSSLIMLLGLVFLRADSFLILLLDVVIGSAIYLTGLLILKAFSKQDKQFIKSTIVNIMSVYPKRKE